MSAVVNSKRIRMKMLDEKGGVVSELTIDPQMSSLEGPSADVWIVAAELLAMIETDADPASTLADEILRSLEG